MWISLFTLFNPKKWIRPKIIIIHSEKIKMIEHFCFLRPNGIRLTFYILNRQCARCMLCDFHEVGRGVFHTRAGVFIIIINVYLFFENKIENAATRGRLLTDNRRIHALFGVINRISRCSNKKHSKPDIFFIAPVFGAAEKSTSYAWSACGRFSKSGAWNDPNICIIIGVFISYLNKRCPHRP